MRLPARNKGAFVVFGLCTLACVVVLLLLVAVQLTGTRSTAYVTNCLSGGRAGTTCEGTWSRHGRTVHGTIEGAGEQDLFDRIPVRLAGARAYKRDTETLILLAVFGALFGAVTAKIYRGRT